MLRYSRAKIAAVLFLAVAGFVYSAPSLMSPETRTALRESTPGFLPSWLMPHQAIVLGLDLQGGSHVLLEVDSAAVLKTQVATLRDDMRRILRDEKLRLRAVLRFCRVAFQYELQMRLNANALCRSFVNW